MPRLPSHPLFAIALTIVVLLSTTGGAIAHANATATPSIFYSDDADTGSDGTILGGTFESFNPDENLEQLAKDGDAMFSSANPNYIFNINNINQTYREWRATQVNTYPESNDSKSVRPIYDCIPHGNGFDPNDEDADTHDSCDKTEEPINWGKGYIKNAHTTILGVEDGVYNNGQRLTTQGTTAEKRTGQTLWIPGSGEVYVQSDFRLDPDSITQRQCTDPDWTYKTVTREELELTRDRNGRITGSRMVTVDETIKTDGERTCKFKEYTDSSVTHELILFEGGSIDGTVKRTLAKKTVETGGTTISYENVSRDNTRKLFVESEYKAEIKITDEEQDWDPDTKWGVENTSTRTLSTSTDGRSRKLPVSISTSQEAGIEQRIINIENSEQTYVFVNIKSTEIHDGSQESNVENFQQKRVWSQLYLGEDQSQFVQNIWGMYSARQYHHTKVYSNTAEDPSIDHRPTQFPAMYMTPENDRPTVQMVDYSKLTSQATVVRYDMMRITRDAPSFRPNVNLSAEPVQSIDTFMLRDSPTGITRAEDIHGDKMPVKTERASGRIPKINISTIDGKQVRVKVTDPVTNDPIPNRNMSVSGAKSSVYTTNSQGVVLLNRTGSGLQVTTAPDDFTKTKDLYYVQSTESASYLASPMLMALIYDLLRSVAFTIPFVVLYWIIDYAQEVEGTGQK